MSYLHFLGNNLRWLTGGFLLTAFSSFGQTFYIALSTGHIRQAFDLTSGEYGSIYMLATLASAMILPFVGQIVDRISVVSVSMITMIMLAISCLLIAIAQSQLLLLVALFGLRLFGQGLMTHIAITAMGRWYAENRGKAVSIASLGFNVGLILFPVIVVLLLRLFDWRQIWLGAAAVMVLVALPSIVLLLRVERLPQSVVTSSSIASGRQWTRSQMLADPLFWLTTFGVLAPSFIGTAIFFHQDYLLSTRGWPLDLFAWGLVIMTIISIISGLISGIAIDRYNSISLLPMFLLPMGLGCLSLAAIDAPIALLAFMALLGIGMGLTSSLTGTLWPEIYGTLHLGSIRSLVMAMMVLFSALGPGVVGWLIDFGVSLSTQLYYMGLYCAIATVALLYCSRRYQQRLIQPGSG